MRFDPESVERIEFCGWCTQTVEPQVRAEDYDALLELYRALDAKMRDLHPNGLLEHPEVAQHPQQPGYPLVETIKNRKDDLPHPPSPRP